VDVNFRRSESLFIAAQFTFDNMRSYYERYCVDWDVKQIADKTIGLENYDIVVGDVVVGVFRLQYENDCCFLRDLQVKSSFQNQGIGKKVLEEAKHLTLQANLSSIKLRVFKISPAVGLYKRNGFEIVSEDDRFFNMEAAIG
jgi:ribosomal protein S18 acetylase RimI-like enzyme